MVQVGLDGYVVEQAAGQRSGLRRKVKRAVRLAGCLRVEGDQVVIDNDVKTIRGWRIDQIYVSDLFGLPSARPPELDADIARRKELLQKSNRTPREQRELKNLEAIVESLPGGETREQAETLRLIQEALETLKKEHSAAP